MSTYVFVLLEFSFNALPSMYYYHVHIRKRHLPVNRLDSTDFLLPKIFVSRVLAEGVFRRAYKKKPLVTC